MNIAERVENLLKRMSGKPQYPTQGTTLFVDLNNKSKKKGYLSFEVVKNFLSGRGSNMFLLYNLLDEDRKPLDPEIPLIFGTGILTGTVPSAARGNFSSISPDSYAIMDSSCGDFFPSFSKLHGYDHIVMYGKSNNLTILKIEYDSVSFVNADKYKGLNNIEFTKRIENDYQCTEGRNMAMARITAAGENLVLNSGIMGGPKALWARGGTGAKMGSLNLKAILILGKPKQNKVSKEMIGTNREIARNVLTTSVVKKALKKVGTPFLYKTSRIICALGTKNNQETLWYDSLDASNIDPYRTKMTGCYKCPIICRPLNDMTPDAIGGWGANAMKGVSGNTSTDESQADTVNVHEKNYNGINNDGIYDKYDKGDGPEYVTLGKFGPNIGIKKIEYVLRLNNILNDLGLDSASTGGSIAWAMELYQRGIITKKETGGMDLSWGNYKSVEKLLFMISKRAGFGASVADSNRAVERGKYPAKANKYKMTIKGLFQSDPHDCRIIKAFALGVAVATRGMDHLRNRATLEINAHINSNPTFKRSLYGSDVSADPTGYEGKEYAVKRCDDLYAVGDSVGMCRFSTKLFNSPNSADYEDFSKAIFDLTGKNLSVDDLNNAGENIIGIERMINYRIGLSSKDDVVPERWFDEEISSGSYKGEKIDRKSFELLKNRFYKISKLNKNGIPNTDFHKKLANIVTGFEILVKLGNLSDTVCESSIIIDKPVTNIYQLRQEVVGRFKREGVKLDDASLNFVVNGNMIAGNEKNSAIENHAEVMLVSTFAGG